MKQTDQQSTTPKDKLGKDITVGCAIVYGHALGRCAGLRIGKVLKIEYEWHEDVWVEHWQTKEKRLHSPAHYTYKIKVWGTDDDYGGFYGVKLNTSSGTLLYPDRIIVVDYNTLPKEYIELLAPVTDGYKAPKKT